MNATVIGLGLIGGSLALSLKDNGLCERVIGVDRSESNARKALELGLVDAVATTITISFLLIVIE